MSRKDLQDKIAEIIVKVKYSHHPDVKLSDATELVQKECLRAANQILNIISNHYFLIIEKENNHGNL